MRGSVFRGRVWHARSVRSLLLAATVVGLTLVQSANLATADEATGAEAVPWREVWIGADVTDNTWLLYSGVTISPFSHIHDDGLRIRFSTGYGQYDYSGLRDPPPCTDIFTCERQPVRQEFDATASFADLLIGYLKRFGELTAKVFVGASYSDHQIAPRDPENEIQGAEWGVKGGVEFWLNVNETQWTSLDAFYSTAHDTYAARFRYGYRLLPTLSVGPELGINGHIQSHVTDGDLVYSRGRGGLFARYDWAGGEIAASSGVSSDIDEDLTPYATLNWMTRF